MHAGACQGVLPVSGPEHWPPLHLNQLGHVGVGEAAHSLLQSSKPGLAAWKGSHHLEPSRDDRKQHIQQLSGPGQGVLRSHPHVPHATL